MARPALLLATATVTVHDIRCAAPRGGCGAERGDDPSHLALVRRGGFAYHPGRARYFADPATALFHRAGTGYRISHPLAHGDCCTSIGCAPALEEEVFGAAALGGRQVAFAVDPHAQLAHLALWRQLAEAGGEPLAGEEAALELLERIRRLPGMTPGPLPGRAARQRLRRRLDDARGLLAEHLDRNLEVAALARALQLSPFHLMRSFRAHTGQTLRGYRRRLRVAAALERLADGHDDLTRLALELGFASHSHMDAAFRRELGQAPAALRQRLSQTGQRQMRRFLQACGPPPP